MSAPLAASGRRAVVQVTLWKGPYLGNFMSGQLALARAVATELDLATHVVLAAGARGRPWLADLDAAGISWSLLPERGRRRGAEHILAVARDREAAILHSHFTGADLETLAAARRAGARCVWQMHTGFERYRLRQRVKDAVKVRRLGRHVDAVVAVSDWVAQLARQRGFPAERVALVPNGIVLDRFDRLPPRDQARARFGLPPEADVVLALGWWPEAKGADVLLAALRRLHERGNGPVALVVGEERLERFLASELPHGAPWLRTSRFVEDPAWLYAAADAFVSASRHEGYSYAVGEALACALPVVLSDIPGTRLFAAAPGVVEFPSGDAGALAGALGRILGDRERAALGAANRAWAREHLAIEPWCARMVALYRRLL